MCSSNDLLVQVKENQPGLIERLRRTAEQAAPLEVAESRDRGRNRQEDRTVAIFDLAQAFAGTDWEPYAATGIRVTRATLVRSAATGQWSEREEVAWHLSSARLPAATFVAAIRGHWAIENRSHSVRDVSMAEDRSRIRINPGIVARLRSWALNILRSNGVQNIGNALWLNCLSLDRILAYPDLSPQN